MKWVLLTTCEELGMFDDNMANYGWAAFGRTERNAYCNLDAVKYRTIRNGNENGSVYLGGTYQFDNGMELTADVHYWETEADNVYYPYFVQQSYDAGYIINNAGEILGAFGEQTTQVEQLILLYGIHMDTHMVSRSKILC